MALVSEDTFAQKVTLIFEYNPDTPLFVHQAHTEIESNNLDKGIEILEKGMEKYLYYPAAYFILGKAYSLKGNYEAALKLYKKGSELINSPETLEHYKKNLEEVKKERSAFEINKRVTVVTHQPPSLTSLPSPQKKSRVDENINQLAQRMTSARISRVSEINSDDPPISPDIFNDKVIPSETLAKIYLDQGEKDEAIKIYNKLIEKFPHKADYFKSKVNEISGS